MLKSVPNEAPKKNPSQYGFLESKADKKPKICFSSMGNIREPV